MNDELLFESERELRGKHCRKLSRKTFGTVKSVAEAFALDYDEKNTTWTTEYAQQYFVPPPPPTVAPIAVKVKVDVQPVPFPSSDENDDDSGDDDDDNNDSDEWVVVDQRDVPPLPVAVSFNESGLKTSKQTKDVLSSSSKHLAKHHVAPVSDQELALEDSFRRSRGFLARTPSTVPYNRYETEHKSAFTPKRFVRHNAAHLYSNPSAIFNILESDDNDAAGTFTEGDFTSIKAASAPTPVPVPEHDMFMALYSDEPPTVSIANSHPESYTSSMLIARVLDVASTITPCIPPPVSTPTKEQNFVLRFLSSVEKSAPTPVPSSSNKSVSSGVKLPTDWSFKPRINQLLRFNSSTMTTTYKPLDIKKQRLGGTAKTYYSDTLKKKSINPMGQAKKTIQLTAPQDLTKKRASGTAKTMAIAAQNNKFAKSLATSKATSKPSIKSPPNIAAYGSCMTDIRHMLISKQTNKLPIKREDFNFADIKKEA